MTATGALHAPTPVARAIDLTRAVHERSRAHGAALIAAGVAFFAALAAVPALTTLVAVYGAVADAADVRGHISTVEAALPAEVERLVERQLDAAVEARTGQLGLGFVASIVPLLWLLSSAARHVLVALTLACDGEERRSALELRARALALVAGAVVGAVVAVLARLGLLRVAAVLDVEGTLGVRIVWWVFVAATTVGAVAFLYRVGPDMPDGFSQRVLPGAVVAATSMIVVAVVFARVVEVTSTHDERFGVLAGPAVLLVWLYIRAMSLVLGAELNAELARRR